MLRREDIIAKQLNSVGLDVTGDLRDVLLDYFCEEEIDRSDNDGGDSDDDDSAEIPPQLPAEKIAERHIFSVGCADDSGSLEELDKKEKDAVDEFAMAPCCVLKCSQVFPKEVIPT